MRLISREEMSDSPYKEQYIDMLIKLLLLKIGDSFRMGKMRLPPVFTALFLGRCGQKYTAMPDALAPFRAGEGGQPKPFALSEAVQRTIWRKLL